MKKGNLLLISPHSDDILFSASKYLFNRDEYDDVAFFTVESGEEKRVMEDLALCELFGIETYFNSDVVFTDKSYYHYYKEMGCKDFNRQDSEKCLIEVYGKEFLNDLAEDILKKVKKYKKKGYKIVTCLGVGHPMHLFLRDTLIDLADEFYRDFPHSYKRKGLKNFESLNLKMVLKHEHFDQEQHDLKFEIAYDIYKTQRSLLFFEKGYIDKNIAEQFYGK